MKSHPPSHIIRKTIKWGGLALTVLIIAVGAASTTRQINVHRYPYAFEFNSGCMSLMVLNDTQPGMSRDLTLGGGRYDRGELHLSLWYWGRTYTNTREYALPMWIPMAGCALVTLVAWRLDTLTRRRAKLNLCPKCNYDRTGIASDAKCPECGSGGDYNLSCL